MTPRTRRTLTLAAILLTADLAAWTLHRIGLITDHKLARLKRDLRADTEQLREDLETLPAVIDGRYSRQKWRELSDRVDALTAGPLAGLQHQIDALRGELTIDPGLDLDSPPPGLHRHHTDHGYDLLIPNTCGEPVHPNRPGNDCHCDQPPRHPGPIDHQISPVIAHHCDHGWFRADAAAAGYAPAEQQQEVDRG